MQKNGETRLCPAQKANDKRSDKELVEKARQLLIRRRKDRWAYLVLGLVGIGACILESMKVAAKLDNPDSIQLGRGFGAGIALALIWITCGVLGATFLAMSGSGFRSGGMRSRELLVCYHDRLRELKALPIYGKADQDP